MAESPLAVGTFGLNLNVTRIIVFSISTFLAALGGIFYASTFGFAAPNDFHFSNLFSLFLLVTLILSPFREPWYVIPSAVGVALPAFWTSDTSQYWINAITGVMAIAVAVQGGPPVMPQKMRAAIDRAFGGKKAEPAPVHTSHLRTDPKPLAEPVVMPGTRGSGLQVDDLVVRFGGLVAVDHFSMTAPLGQITG